MSENCQLRQDIEFLQRRLEQAQQTVDKMQEERQKAQERSDMIVMQLTRQLEQQTLLLEDMRHRSIWRRLKAVFATEAV
jgi:F0F1-type ATP synthase membrane subunit b/b'